MEERTKKAIASFLQLKKPTDDQVKDAALMLLKLNPAKERSIYNTAMRRPQSMLPWIRTDLKKYLDIENRGLTAAKTAAFNAETVKLVTETLQQRPDGVEEEKKTVIPVLGIRGKRADHDSLPENVRQLWDKNSERWKKIRALHEQLAVMVAQPGYQPCDGNELCHTLRQADIDLRNDYERYDSYQPGSNPAAAPADSIKAIQSARTCITRGVNRKNQTAEQLQKLQEAVNTLVRLKQKMKPDTISKLKAAGVSVPEDA